MRGLLHFPVFESTCEDLKEGLKFLGLLSQVLSELISLSIVYGEDEFGQDLAVSQTLKQGATLFISDDALVFVDERLKYLGDALGQKDEASDFLVLVVDDKGEGKLGLTLALESLAQEEDEAVWLNNHTI